MSIVITYLSHDTQATMIYEYTNVLVFFVIVETACT